MKDKVSKKIENLTDELNSLVAQQEELNQKMHNNEIRITQVMGALESLMSLMNEEEINPVSQPEQVALSLDPEQKS